MDIEFDYKGDPVGGVISTCKPMKIIISHHSLSQYALSRFTRKGM